mgnify:CR=1 FL=1
MQRIVSVVRDGNSDFDGPVIVGNMCRQFRFRRPLSPPVFRRTAIQVHKRAGRIDRLEGMALSADLQARARGYANEFVALASDIETPGPLTALAPLEVAAAELEADKSQLRGTLIAMAARG